MGILISNLGLILNDNSFILILPIFSYLPSLIQSKKKAIQFLLNYKPIPKFLRRVRTSGCIAN